MHRVHRVHRVSLLFSSPGTDGKTCESKQVRNPVKPVYAVRGFLITVHQIAGGRVLLTRPRDPDRARGSCSHRHGHRHRAVRSDVAEDRQR